MKYQTGLEFAQQMDLEDKLSKFREHFHFPKHTDGEDEIYLVGNSLGLQPRSTKHYLSEELEKWQRLGVKGHFESKLPWMPYHEFLTESTANLVGAELDEVVTMNSLTVNLHLMMVSFYRPTAKRNKILIEKHAFPSDHYAVESQIRHHGFDPEDSMLLAEPREGEDLLRTEDLLELIKQEGDSIALILLPGVQYYTGQVLEMEKITFKGHEKGCIVGFDLAHAAGNIPLELHDWGIDFACWCTYKYMNSGPGATGACFVHNRHADKPELNRFKGWWGHDKHTRFKMDNKFEPTIGAEGWQISNAPVLSMAATRASLDEFMAAGGMRPLRKKAEKLTGYMEFLLKEELAEKIEIITPSNPKHRGSQLSLRMKGGKTIFRKLESAGVSCDWRDPNVIRAAPVPLYNSFKDVYRFVEILKGSF